jgi:hypothetical protein
MGTVDVQVRTRVTKDRRDTFVNLDTPTPGWEVRKTNANRSNNDEGFTINTDIFLANPKEGLNFRIGRTVDVKRDWEGTWNQDFFGDLSGVPEGISVQIARLPKVCD